MTVEKYCRHAPEVHGLKRRDVIIIIMIITTTIIIITITTIIITITIIKIIIIIIIITARLLHAPREYCEELSLSVRDAVADRLLSVPSVLCVEPARSVRSCRSTAWMLPSARLACCPRLPSSCTGKCSA